jgi:hypothetical protein
MLTFHFYFLIVKWEKSNGLGDHAVQEHVKEAGECSGGGGVSTSCCGGDGTSDHRETETKQAKNMQSILTVQSECRGVYIAKVAPPPPGARKKNMYRLSTLYRVKAEVYILQK